MKKEFTEKQYENYMKVLDDYIKKVETAINDLWKFKEVRQLSYEDWVKFQNGKLKNR
jgi:hypothetical protein